MKRAREPNIEPEEVPDWLVDIEAKNRNRTEYVWRFHKLVEEKIDQIRAYERDATRVRLELRDRLALYEEIGDDADSLRNDIEGVHAPPTYSLGPYSGIAWLDAVKRRESANLRWIETNVDEWNARRKLPPNENDFVGREKTKLKQLDRDLRKAQEWVNRLTAVQNKVRLSSAEAELDLKIP
jgi:hypothetical protein